MRVGEERERRYRVAPKDFACRTAIKPVAPCRGDFCADIFSILSFVPHRGFKALALLLSFSFPFPFVLAFFLSLAPPSPRIRALSSSICQFIFVPLFPSWRVLRPRPVSRPRSRAAFKRESLHPRASRLTHEKFSKLGKLCSFIKFFG